MTRLHPVIPAGGSGKRLWPLSRVAHPKFLHAIGGEPQSLLMTTYERLSGVADPNDIMIVTGGLHAPKVARELPELPPENIVVEPSARDSAPAISLAAALIRRKDEAAVMGSFAADHVIRDVPRFNATTAAAIEAAADGKLVTIGVTPTRPETGYGYVKCGAHSGVEVLPVEEFKEKPELELAIRYVDSGEYLWNASMFVWQVSTYLEELRRRSPEMHDGVEAIADAWGTDSHEDVLTEIWPQLPKVAIDYLVMEPAAADGMVVTIPGDFGWADVGDFSALAELYEGDDLENVVLPEVVDGVQTVSERFVARDCKGMVVVPGGERLIAAIGLTDVIVVDTPDALLLCDRSRVQDVKQIVAHLEARGATDLL